MKKFMLLLLTIAVIVHISFSFFIFNQRNNFNIQYAKTDPLYKPEVIENLSFDYDINLGGDAWQLQSRGNELDVIYQGKSDLKDDWTMPDEGLILVPKVDPAVVSEHEDDAKCIIDDNGDDVCSLYFTVTEIELNLVIRRYDGAFTKPNDQVMDTITIQAKDEAIPISVLIGYTNDYFLDDMSSITINPTRTETITPSDTLHSGSYGKTFTYEDKNHKKKDFYVCYSELTQRFQPAYYDVSKNCAGIYVVNDHKLEKILDYNAIQESYAILDVIDDEILTGKRDSSGAEYLESYDIMGNRIAQIPLGTDQSLSHYYVKNHLFIEHDYIEADKSNFSIHKYQDGALMMIDKFEGIDATNIDMYHNGMIYQISLNTREQQPYVSVYDHEGAVFREVLNSSIFENLEMYFQLPDNEKIGAWDQLMRPGDSRNSGSRLTNIEINNK